MQDIWEKKKNPGDSANQTEKLAFIRPPTHPNKCKNLVPGLKKKNLNKKKSYLPPAIQELSLRVTVKANDRLSTAQGMEDSQGLNST